MIRILLSITILSAAIGAAGYLERAYGTARAYFEVPANIRMEGGWSFTGWVYWQYTVGNFHEKYLLPLIAALEAEGQQTKADFLRAEWEKKVKCFIYDNVTIQGLLESPLPAMWITDVATISDGCWVRG